MHLIVVHQLAPVLLDDLAGFLGGHLRDLDFALPVLDAVLEVDQGVLLLDELNRVWHVTHHLLQCLLPLVLLVHHFYVLMRVLDVGVGPSELLLFDFHFVADLVLERLGVEDLLFQIVEGEDDLCLARLQIDNFLVSLFDFLYVLLVLNLELMEINELQVITHVLFRLDLVFLLANSVLEGHVFELQLVDKGVLRLEFVLHVFHKLFGIVLASPPVLSGRQETAKVNN